MAKIASGFIFGALLIFTLVLASGCTSVFPPAANTTTRIVYVTVFVTPTPTLPPVNTNIMGAVGYITPRPTPTFDPSKYVQPWLGYEDSSGSGYIDNNGNTAAVIHRHETSLVVNTTPKGPTYNNGNTAAAIYRHETSLVVNTAPKGPTYNTVNTNELNAGRVGPDLEGRSVYAGMTKGELAALLNQSGAVYDSKGTIVQYCTGSHSEQDCWAAYIAAIS